MAREDSLSVKCRIANLKSLQHYAIPMASIVPRQERIRLHGMIDEVLADSTDSMLANELKKLKSVYLSVKGCNVYCAEY